ncbi:Xylose isomerase-like TIM barrel [Phycisphaerae bacterium RAS1]|nr:Xylose isomerase-like TIM barrel [Phycisphaerae bacterium RAS1]
MQMLARIHAGDDPAAMAAGAAAARAAGFSDCELMVARPLQSLPRLDVRPISLLLDPDPLVRGADDVLVGIAALLDSATRCGVQCLTLPAGLPAGLADDEPPVSYESAFQSVFRTLDQAKHVAAACSVRIALAVPHARFLLSPLEAADLIDAVNSPHVGLCVVTAAAQRIGSATDWLRIAGGRLFLVDMIETANQDSLIAALRSLRYDGPVVVHCAG